MSNTQLTVPFAEAMTRYEPIIGLEVHVELGTNSKMFCSCATTFGASPNTQVCPVCLGLPGSMPVLNKVAVESTIRIGLALNCEIATWCRFARKNYFYPDMPKDYQVSQYDEPLCTNGWLDVTVATDDGPQVVRVEIERVHMEEDTGKLTHAGGATGRIHGADYSLVDYNRAGIPLIEIVTKTVIGTGPLAPAVARAYVTELRDVMRALGVSDVRMEEGSLRCDVNLSLNRPGAGWGTRSETKNVNSLRSVERAVHSEIERQAAVLDGGGRVIQETRHFHEDTGRSTSGRSKEQAEDYRYFPEPDLVPLVPDADWVASVRAALPPLPAARRRVLADAAGVESGAVALHVERDLDALALAAIAAGADPMRVLNHVEHNLAVDGAAQLDAGALADLVGMETSGELTSTQAKQVLADMVATGNTPAAIAAERGFEAMDTGALDAALDAVIAEFPNDWADFCAADDPKKKKKLTGFFTGKIMAATGHADTDEALGR